MINRRLVDEDPLEFISVASEYDLASLKVLAISRSVRLVNENNLKCMLQAAHIYDITTLKNACVKFVKKNPLAVLVNANISSLRTEDPDLWNEFKNSVYPNNVKPTP
jgi:hypothetical protein